MSQPISRVLSRTVIHLGHTSLHASSNLPVFNASHALTSSLGSKNEHLFGLAPSGVYLAARVTTNAVRSYRTISPLLTFKFQTNLKLKPLKFGLSGHEACYALIFSVLLKRRKRYLSAALAVGSRRPDVIWHSALRSPDFPPLLAKRRLPS
jgi:hypothetical protein